MRNIDSSRALAYIPSLVSVFFRILALVLVVLSSGALEAGAVLAGVQSDCQDDEAGCDCNTCWVACSCCPPGRAVTLPTTLTMPEKHVEDPPLLSSDAVLVAVAIAVDIFHPPRA